MNRCLLLAAGAVVGGGAPPRCGNVPRLRTASSVPPSGHFFDPALTSNTFWVDLKAIDLSADTAKVMRPDLGSNQDHIYSGNATKVFKPSPAFQFLGLKA